MRLRFKNINDGIIEIVGTDLTIVKNEEEDRPGHYWTLETQDAEPLMMDTNLAKMKWRVQTLYETLGRLWVQ